MKIKIIEKLKDFFDLSDKTKIKFLLPCLVSNGFVLSIFIPWSKIFKSNKLLETTVGLLCMFLIGLLILFVFEWILIVSYIASFVLYIVFIIKNWKVKRARIFIVIFTCIMLFSFLFFKEVEELYKAALTGSWWGDSKYFGGGF
jgi:uncharacterized membrane protein YfhO